MFFLPVNVAESKIWCIFAIEKASCTSDCLITITTLLQDAFLYHLHFVHTILNVSPFALNSQYQFDSEVHVIAII